MKPKTLEYVNHSQSSSGPTFRENMKLTHAHGTLHIVLPCAVLLCCLCCIVPVLVACHVRSQQRAAINTTGRPDALPTLTLALL